MHLLASSVADAVASVPACTVIQVSAHDVVAHDVVGTLVWGELGVSAVIKIGVRNTRCGWVGE